MGTELEQVCRYVEEHTQEFIQVLKDAVAIPSISASSAMRGETRRMAEWMRDLVMSEFAGSEVELIEVDGMETCSDGSEIPYPPLLIAKVGKFHSGKKTLLVYGHYDVQPAEKSDGWDTEPFVLTELDNGELRGRGSTDDKGPLVGWICMLKSYEKTGQEFPVNVKFIMEGMEESGSVGFDATAAKIKKDTDFFSNIDFCCVSDNYWLTTEKPCLTYGLRGLTAATVEVSGPSCDLHSGSFGGQVFEPMDDLLYLLNTIKDAEGKILIPGVYDDVMAVTEHETSLYEKILFDTEAKRSSIHVDRIRNQDDKTKCLMSVWRNPNLSIHGMEGAYSEPGFKTVIPRKVSGKFSIRTVPNMQSEKIEQCIKDHLEKMMQKRASPNKLKVDCHSGRWWYVDPTSKPFEAAKKATVAVHGVEPDYTREGGSIPICLTLSEMAEASLCLLPMGRCDDGAHSQNEKLDISNFLLGMKTFAHFLHQLAVV